MTTIILPSSATGTPQTPIINEQFLMQTVYKACSQNPVELKEAEATLQQLETQTGYCINLFKIITDYSLSVNVRCMSCVCLKNAIDKYWRKTAANSIREEERLALKTQFLQFLNEPELKVARQMSVILGKIARFDLPHQWPDLIPKLLQILQETEQNLIQSRALMALHQIIKALSSKRLTNDRKVFEEISVKLIDMLVQMAFVYVHKCLIADEPHEQQQLLSLTKQDLDQHLFYLDQAILCLKIIHKLVVHGFKDNVESNHSLDQLSHNLIQSFDKLLTKYNRLMSLAQQQPLLGDYFKEKYEYISVLYVQILCDFQENYPFYFVQACMSDCLNVVIQVCFTVHGKQLSFPALSIILMNFMKSIIMCDKYKQRLIKMDDALMHARQLKSLEIKQMFLTPANLRQILEFLFNEYMLITSEELEQWRDTPEEFVNEDGLATDAWKYNFRACAETLFQAFVHEYHDFVVPIVVQLIETYSIKQKVKLNGELLNGIDNNNKSTSLTNGNDNNNEDEHYILLKDAAYNCGSIAAWELVSHIDFDMWFTQALLPEMQQPHCSKLIKRRILMLIANWVNIKLSAENRIATYQLLCQCLQSSEDLVIRLQATLTLKCVLDDIHFEKDAYLPYLSFHFGLLCQLLKESEECETKIKVLNVLSFLIERVDIHIRPFSAQLADYLPFLWNESLGLNMLQCCIVTTFYNIVKSFGAQSVRYHSFLMPVIHYATDVQNPASVYLLEDALELWNITVQNSVQMTPDMLKLFENIKPLLDRDTEVWKLCLDIIDSYVVLDGRQVFQYYGEFLMNKCCDILSDSIKIDALLRLMRSVGHMFEVPDCRSQMQLFEPFVLKSLTLALSVDVYPMIVAMCLSMLAKPVLVDSDQFMKVLEKYSAIQSVQPEKAFGDLLDSWIDKIDMIVQDERRKLTALALLSLLRFNSHIIYQRFGAIINVCETVMLDVLKEDNGVKYDCLIVNRENVENDDEEVDTEHEKRKRRLRLNDPVYTISLKDFCIERLRECETLLGVQQFQQLMNSIDKNILLKLNELLSS